MNMTIRKLDPFDVLACPQLIPPFMRNRLVESVVLGRSIVFGMWVSDAIEGVIVLEKEFLADGQSDLCEIKVFRPPNQDPVETEISRGYLFLKAVVDEANRLGISRIYAKLMDSQPHYQRNLDWFTKAGFSPSGYVREIYVVDGAKGEFRKGIARLYQAYGHWLDLPPGFRFQWFRDLTEAEYMRIRSEIGSVFPVSFNPFCYDPYAPDCDFESCSHDTTPSLFLFDEDRPVGWIIYQTQTVNAYLVSLLYVEEPYRNSAAALQLITHSLNMLPDTVSKVAFYVNQDNRKHHRNLDQILDFFIECPIRHDRLVEYLWKSRKEAEE